MFLQWTVEMCRRNAPPVCTWKKLCEKVPADVPLCFYLENLSKCCHEMSANPKRRSSERSPVFQECKINVCSSACSGFFICLYNLCSDKLPSGAGGCSSSPGFCYEGWRFSESGLPQWLCFLQVTALLAAEDAGFCRLHAEQTEFVASWLCVCR